MQEMAGLMIGIDFLHKDTTLTVDNSDVILNHNASHLTPPLSLALAAASVLGKGL